MSTNEPTDEPRLNDASAEEPEAIDAPDAGADVPDAMLNKNSKTGRMMIGFVIAMFGAGFASIPLYRLVCHNVDPGGSSYENGTADQYANTQIDKSRTVRVRLAAAVNSQLPWDFTAPQPAYVDVHPGAKTLVHFHAKNLDSTGKITGKAVYDINPPEAGKYFKKIQCFCFTTETLKAGESRDMPVLFWVDPKLPKNIKEISLAYTFFNADSSMKRTMEQRTASR